MREACQCRRRGALEFGMGGVLPEPQSTAHGGETEAGRHDRANFRLQQPFRHEVVFRLAGDVDEPCVPSGAVPQRLGVIQPALRLGQMVALPVMRYLVLATMRDTIGSASHADRVPLHPALLFVSESEIITIHF